ncbi:hypothetical protein SAMN04487839_11813 [Streptococcus gallolyticus]|uniref:Phage protein n=1 Tax=Streptococcus gallolyticus TaxID=315405 RepID=A0A1H7XQL9_9STRE|nr:hypothetical protein [Streptococcus gallolyticus]SEF25511.1 hypothetical protein SAMN02910295_0146 [Streptococcus gallolyticus]SEM36242.1 hypothetical protein SAMN04487839_11813 [Streptococcus gallolyticus]
MIYYLYESHSGDAYITKRKASYDETYCDMCNDSDELLGKFKNEAQLRKLLEREDFYPEAIDYIVKDWKEANDAN